MRKYKIAIMEGDGIGHEIVRETVKVLKKAEEKLNNSSFSLVNLDVGLVAYEKKGHTLPEETIVALKSCDGGILGPVTTHLYDPNEKNMPNPSGMLRKKFDLYANIRPAKNYPNVKTKFKDVDLLVVRENTEGMYSDRNLFEGKGEFKIDPDTAISLRVITKKCSERLAKVGFLIANQRRKYVSVIHKRNVLRLSCGLFVENCEKIAKKYPNVKMDDYHVDAFSMFLVQHPEKFDVILTTNMFGDIISDLCAGLIGGLGLAPGLNLGDNFMLAQATHGSAPTIAGQNIANPIAEILSMQMMIEWLGFKNNDKELIEVASTIDNAVINTLKKNVKTPDLGGKHSTSDVGDQIIVEMDKLF